MDRAAAAEVVEICDAQGFTDFAGMGRMLRAAASAAEGGDPQAALEEGLGGVSLAASTGRRGGLPAFVVALATIQRAAGKLDDALGTIDGGWRLPRRPTSRTGVPICCASGPRCCSSAKVGMRMKPKPHSERPSHSPANRGIACTSWPRPHPSRASRTCRESRPRPSWGMHTSLHRRPRHQPAAKRGPGTRWRTRAWPRLAACSQRRRDGRACQGGRACLPGSAVCDRALGWRVR